MNMKKFASSIRPRSLAWWPRALPALRGDPAPWRCFHALPPVWYDERRRRRRPPIPAPRPQLLGLVARNGRLLRGGSTTRPVRVPSPGTGYPYYLAGRTCCGVVATIYLNYHEDTLLHCPLFFLVSLFILMRSKKKEGTLPPDHCRAGSSS